ncbi:MAG: MerR family transcriptional regulator, partial [Thermodesulfobacteriota bacterium]|nr:MerR family transcriptional regulator [Thermodesulfobacteriota bacterium]
MDSKLNSKNSITPGVTNFPVSSLTWDHFIYPRAGKSEKTINAYVEALAIGAQFPPIKIQRVFNYAKGDQTTDLPAGRHGATIILDGIHRWFAFKEKAIKEIAAVEWKDKPLDYEKSKVALLLESAKCNISHGDRLSPGDKKRIAREIATSDPECKWTEEALAEKLGVIQQTVNTWISDIRARQKAGRNTVILRLSRLGWPQEKISETVEINQQRISQITNNTN